MAVKIDPDDLFQGTVDTTGSDIVWTGALGNQVTITSAGSFIPTLADDEFFEVRDHSETVNNGLYRVNDASPAAGTTDIEKVSGANPTNSGAEQVTFLGTSGATTEKSIFYDTAARGVYLLEQGNLDGEGATGQAVYSRMMIDWKDDSFLIAQAPFPMFTIDADAGKYIIGQDASGNNNGWNWVDDVGGFGIRTRKLLRNAGWSEVDSAGNITAQHAGIGTLGTFDAPARVGGDQANFQFGNDTEVDDTNAFEFTGPVNEAIPVFTRLADGAINGGTGIAISADGRTLTRSDGGNWRTDGFIVGGKIQLRDSEDAQSDGTWLLTVVGSGVDGVVTGGRAADATDGVEFADGGGGDDSLILPATTPANWAEMGFVVGSNIIITAAEDAGNNGTHIITSFSADRLTAFVATASFTANADDTTAVIGMFDDALTPDVTVNAAVDNRNAIKLTLRVEAKTYGQANLASGGHTILSNRFFTFPLSNLPDLNIIDNDTFVDGANEPYQSMALEIYATAQSRGGGGPDELVGGPYNFGYIVTTGAQTPTDQQTYTWVQRQLRLTSDIDSEGANPAIGVTIDGLMGFVGSSLKIGTTDDGLTFPVNPQGGGSGVFVEGLASVSRNSTDVFDNLNTRRGYPIGTPVTLDFNQTLIDDTVAEYTLFFDWTIQTAVDATFVITAVSGSTGTFDSTTQFPTDIDGGDGGYVRVSGLTGADEPMNGIYQVNVTTSSSQWSVTRWDGATIVTTAGEAATIDEHPANSPSAIIVQDNSPADVQGLASVDFSFTFDYSNNNQGGRTTSTDAIVLAKAIGQQTAQYTESSLQTIESGIALTIPVSSQIERNFTNP